MRLFEIGDEVLFYEHDRRVYGTVAGYSGDDTVTVTVTDEDGDAVRTETMSEQHLRPADDPDDPEPQRPPWARW